MSTATKKTTRKKTALAGAVKPEKKKKSLLDIAKKLAEKPLFSIDKKDEDLIFGENMMTKLMKE